MKKNLIITEAKQIKSYVEKNKKIPLTNQYTNGKIYSIYTTSYLLGSVVSNWSRTDVDPVPVIIYNQKKHLDTINEKVTKQDYLKMTQNFLLFCKQNRRVPTYITTQKTGIKVSFELFTYCLSKIVSYYAENNRLPNTCLFNKKDLQYIKTNEDSSKNSTAKPTSTCTNPYNSSKGCEAMGQNNSWYCGVSALQKCLYKLGIKNVTQKQLAGVCGTTTKGTSHQGLKTGVAWASKKFGIPLKFEEAYFSDYTLKQMHSIVCNPNKSLMIHSCYRNSYGHYEFVKAVEVDKKEFEIVNSLGSKCPLGCYCGYVEERSYSTQKSYCNGTSQKSLIIISKG